MSDQAEAPPKKIGSLRDRIAAFEKAGAGSAGPAPSPPAPRPKPAGFSNWKPRPPSPTSGEPSQAAAPAKASPGFSAADAKDSITKGQSLKERMAALQGKGGFGGPPPVAPKPALEKPKWKPPPVIAAPKDDDDEEDQPRKPLDFEGMVRSPPTHEPESMEAPGGEEGEAKESGTAEGEEAAEADPEEEERQRRAAIAARLARLGGARVGMAPPPVFGKRPPPPPKKRMSVSEDVASSEPPREVLTSPKLQATDPETAPKETASTQPASSSAPKSPPADRTPVRRPSEASSITSIETSESQNASRSPPSSMPVPAAPRRAAPPRKKPAKPTAPPPPVPEADAETLETTPAESDARVAEPAPEQEPSTSPPKEALVTPLPPTPAASEDTTGSVQVVSEPEVSLAATRTVGEDDAGVDTPVAPRAKSPAEEEPEAKIQQEEKQEVVEPEQEVDEDTKRRQVAERIARMGGINPFAAPTLPRRQSSKLEEDIVSPPPVAAEEEDVDTSKAKRTSQVLEQSPPAPPSRRSSKLSEAPTSPRLPPTQEKRLSRGSVESSHSKILSQETTYQEPASVVEEDERGQEEEVTKEVSPPITKPSSDTAKSGPPVPKEVPAKDQLLEDDGDSEYSDNNEDLKADIDSPPPAALPPRPPVHHFHEIPHRNVPSAPAPVEARDEEDEVSSEDNEEMMRSQILVPPKTGTSKHDIPPVTGDAAHKSVQPGSVEEQLAYDDSGSEYGDEEHFAHPHEPTFVPPPPPPGRPNLPPPSPPPPANRALPPTPPTIVHVSSQTSLKVPTPAEVLDDDEGDPIDPSFHSPSRRTSQVLPAGTSVVPPEDSLEVPQEQTQAQAPVESQEDAEAARRRTIAERMAKLGGIKFGAAPPVPGMPKRAPPPPQEYDQNYQESEEAAAPQADEEVDEEAEERARKERIAAKLAGMGGMRIGMMPSAFPTRKSHVLTEESAAPAPPARGPPARPLPPPQTQEIESDAEGSTASEDVVKVEAEESEPEEVQQQDAEEEGPPPPIPSRASRPIRKESVEIASSPPMASSPPTRPPVPTGLPPRRQSTTSQRRVSGDSAVSPPPSNRRPSLPKPQTSEYVMVEEPAGYEEDVPPPLPPSRPAVTRRASGAPTRSPPPPKQEDSLTSQWELPSIPTSNLDMGGSDLEMSWTEAEVPRDDDGITPSASTLGPRIPAQSPPQQPSIQSSSTKSSLSANDLQLSADDLMALWGRVGVQVCEAATNLFERSKKSLVGDGTYPGFIYAVVRDVPNALLTEDYGYVVYKQTGAAVQKRASDILPGDLVEMHDAKFKGHKGLQAYHQNVGAEEPVVGVIGEFDAKKSKIRVFQANQHVGQQTVESVSYRLEDLKSGVVKVYRVLEAQ